MWVGQRLFIVRNKHIAAWDSVERYREHKKRKKRIKREKEYDTDKHYAL